MIISHKYRFIFIKLRKTAGTSLEIALSGICGENDIITPISEDDEQIRREMGFRTAQNHLGTVSFYNHMPASEIRENIPPEVWDTYFKFCFERNPWDKALSHYFHRNRNGKFKDFTDYFLNDTGDMIRGFDMYSIDDDVVVDKVYRFEEIEKSLEELSGIMQLESPLKMPSYRAKSQFRTDKRHYRDILSSEELIMVSKRFHREIGYLGYNP